MRDKDIKSMFAELLPNCNHTVLTSIGVPRSMLPDELDSIAAAYDCPTTLENNIENALNIATRLAGNNGVVVVAGSITIAASIRLLVTRKRLYTTLRMPK